jgi:hypothetical protein
MNIIQYVGECVVRVVYDTKLEALQWGGNPRMEVDHRSVCGRDLISAVDYVGPIG